MTSTRNADRHADSRPRLPRRHGNVTMRGNGLGAEDGVARFEQPVQCAHRAL